MRLRRAWEVLPSDQGHFLERASVFSAVVPKKKKLVRSVAIVLLVLLCLLHCGAVALLCLLHCGAVALLCLLHGCGAGVPTSLNSVETSF